MQNIVLFKPRLTDVVSSAYKTYIKLYEDNIINNPIIFCDSCEILINNNICVFNGYFLRQHFLDYFILVDYDDMKFLNNFQNRKCIVMYDTKIHTITEFKNNYIPLAIASDNIENIKDILDEKI